MTGPEALFDRDSSLFVARGLYILRYQSGSESSEHPVAAAAPAPGFEDVIQVISAPGSAEGRLDRPGGGPLVTLLIVIACVTAGRLLSQNRHFFDVAVGSGGDGGAAMGAAAAAGALAASWLSSVL